MPCYVIFSTLLSGFFLVLRYKMSSLRQNPHIIYKLAHCYPDQWWGPLYGVESRVNAKLCVAERTTSIAAQRPMTHPALQYSIARRRADDINWGSATDDESRSAAPSILCRRADDVSCCSATDDATRSPVFSSGFKNKWNKEAYKYNKPGCCMHFLCIFPSVYT